MSKLSLNNKELREILVDKYGEIDFQIFYTEPQELWADRNRIDLTTIESLEGLPKKFQCVLHI